MFRTYDSVKIDVAGYVEFARYFFLFFVCNQMHLFSPIANLAKADNDLMNGVLLTLRNRFAAEIHVEHEEPAGENRVFFGVSLRFPLEISFYCCHDFSILP